MKYDFIFLADLHVRSDVPVARTDDFIAAQTNKLKFISKIQKENDSLVLIAGDIFDKAISSPFVEKRIIDTMPFFYGIPGQHDLPYHNINNYTKSSLSLIEAANRAKILITDELIELKNKIYITGFPFGSDFENRKAPKGYYKKIALVHQMIHSNKKIHDSLESTFGLDLLKKSNYDIIVIGDNHQSFIYEYKNRYLINCGSMMRNTAGQREHVPCVWLWNSEKNVITKKKIPCEQDVLSREHIEIKEQKDKRMFSFIQRMNNSYEIKTSFVQTVTSLLNANKVKKRTKEILYECME